MGCFSYELIFDELTLNEKELYNKMNQVAKHMGYETPYYHRDRRGDDNETRTSEG